MGLLDAFKQYVKDAMPGGLLNAEWTPQNVRNAGEAMSMIPNPVGDVASGLLAVDDLRKGDYGSAALNSIGLLPFVPAMGGVLDDVAKIYGKNVDIYAKPSLGEIGKILRDQRNTGMNGSVRLLKDPKTGKVTAWNGSDATHDDIMEYMKSHMPQESRYEIFTTRDYIDLQPELYIK